MNHKLNVALAGLALLAAAGSASAQEVVKIGHVGPTSGGIAHLGKDNENGARMAVALTSEGCDLTLPHLAERADAFYLGGTKNGMLFGEEKIAHG